MKEVTITFTEEEYIELAKLVTLGSFMATNDPDYENFELVQELEVKIGTHGLIQLPDSGCFTAATGGADIDLPTQEFGISDELYTECEEIEELYIEDKALEYLVNRLGYRDFTEEYGDIDEAEVLQNKEYFDFIMSRQAEYREEFSANGLDNLFLDAEDE